MQSAFIVKDKTGKPYAVISILSGGTNFYPIAESATNWSSWMEDEYAARAITKQQLIATLDNSMDIEGPLSYNRVNKVKIDELIGKAKKVPATEPIETAKEQKSELVPVLSLLDVRIDNLGNDEWRNAVEFKAKSFIADVNKATFSYEVKRTRAAWDPTLAVPGTDRQGGWRCPPGTRYGGQITDRFGRNCGWGASRRIANEISDLGERLENVGERRRERRVVRRNERMVRRLQQGGAVERAAGRVANVLDVTGRDNGPAAGKPRGAGLIERAAGRVAEALETDNNTGRQRRQQGQNRQQPGLLERAAGRAARALETDSGRTPPRRPRPQAPRAPQARPARPRQPRVLREDRDMPNLPNFRPNDPVGNRQKYIAQMEEDLQRRKREAKRNRPDGVPDRDWKKYRDYVDGVQNQYGFGGADRRSSIQSFDDWAKANGVNRPDAPRQPEVDNVNIPVPAGRPNRNESLEAYKTRKYNEHQQRVREINLAGGNAGLLRRSEWEKFHGPTVEDNWNRLQEQNGGRAARRAATSAPAARVANRRPKATDVPDEVQPPVRQRRPFNAPNQRGLNSELAAKRKRIEMQRNNPNENYKLVKHNDKYYVVSDAEVDRANANGANINVIDEPPRPPDRRPAVPPVTPNTTPPSPAQGDIVARPVNRVMNRRQKSLPILADSNGRVKRVPTGNAGINTSEDAKNFTGSITEVPDEFLKDALDARAAKSGDVPQSILSAVRDARLNPSSLTPQNKIVLKQLKESGKSYVAVGGGSITSPTFYMHIADDGSIDGRGYLFKPEDPAATGKGQHSELVGIEIARRMGFAQGMPRVVNKNNRAFLLLELGPNFAEGHAALYNAGAVSDERSRMGHFVANMLIHATDRHGGNGMYFPGDGALPIDFGRGFARDNYQITPVAMANYSFGSLDATPTQGYKKLVSDGILNEVQAKAKLKADLSEWRRSVEAMFNDGSYDSFRGLIPNARNGSASYLSVSGRKARMQDRLALLDSDEFIEAVWNRR